MYKGVNKMKFVKLIEGMIEEAPVNIEKDGAWICNYNLDSNSEMLLEDGYKIFHEGVKEPDHYYQISYEEAEVDIYEVLTDVTEEVNRQNKIKEISSKIEELKQASLDELRANNMSSVKTLNQIIAGLEETKGEL